MQNDGIAWLVIDGRVCIKKLIILFGTIWCGMREAY